ncbi:MAG: PKD domain-containing protein [Candidatus Bipolaricaulota bacterium]|nr:PKD domain-containing protein [Candidatus Bipolaricaulota bacterium]
MTKMTRIALLLALLAGVLLAIAGCTEAPSVVACIQADPTIGHAPLTVAFDAACTYVPPERAASYDYRWEFGDGADASGRSTIHTFTAPGTYEVFVVVGHLNMGEWDAASSAMRVITVLPVP